MQMKNEAEVRVLWARVAMSQTDATVAAPPAVVGLKFLLIRLEILASSPMF